ncbi:MAG: hypothetical protein ACI4NM_02345 [Bullifex sp.]
MKKYPLLLFLIISVLLSSCQTGRKDSGYTPDEILLITTGLRSSIQQAILDTESELFEKQMLLSDVPEYSEYTSALPGFRILMDDYLEEISRSVRGALVSVSDRLITYISGYTFTDVKTVLESGYSSVSQGLRDELGGEVTMIFEEALQDSSESIGEAFGTMKAEAEIWRKNLANLALVGQEMSPEPIKPVDEHGLAVLAMESYFNGLAENEVRIRAKGEGNGK